MLELLAVAVRVAACVEETEFVIEGAADPETLVEREAVVVKLEDFDRDTVAVAVCDAVAEEDHETETVRDEVGARVTDGEAVGDGLKEQEAVDDAVLELVGVGKEEKDAL